MGCTASTANWLAVAEARLAASGDEEEAAFTATVLSSASIAVHEAKFTMTLVDPSEQMIAGSRQLNPECEHLCGDMRAVRLGRDFHAVLVPRRHRLHGSRILSPRSH